MSRKRATQAELIKRREEIQQLILRGVNSSDIVKDMAEKWDTSPRAISEDIRAIKKEWEVTAAENTQLMKNKYDQRLEMLFNKALSEGQYKTALEIQKEISKLNGLYKEKEADENQMPEIIRVKRRSATVVTDDNEQQH